MNRDIGKQQAAQAALSLIADDSVVGIGTGSTVDLFIDALAGIRQRISGAVSSSEASTARLRKLGIRVLELNSTGDLDLYVDGADEANEHLQLIKGGGGALTREKIIAEASHRFVCIVDASKLVKRLGRFPLPVEVIPMGRSLVARRLVKLGGQPVWRDGYVTDNGNEIVDVHNLQILDARALENEINQIPGVVTVGLFARRGADLLLVGDERGVRRLERR